MMLSSRVRTLLALAAALVAFVGGAATGIGIADRTNVPHQRDVVIADPTGASGGIQALRSTGGFTGFDAPAALAGSVARTGTMSATQNGAFEVTSAGSTLAARTTSGARLFRIERASSAPARGDAVLVRLDAGGVATGVLRLPGDLHEGENRAPTPTPRPSASATPTAAAPTPR